MSKTKFTTIIFDYGGVLELSESINYIQYTAELIGISEEALREEYQKHNYLANTKEVPWLDMFLKVVSKFDTSDDTLNKVKDVYDVVQKSKKVNTELKEKIISLKSKGFTVAVLSNYSTKLRAHMSENGLGAVFDNIFVSGEIGYQKPDVELFKIVFAKLGVSSDEVVFIDDTKRSLETASEIGYTPILFLNNEQLFSDLHSLGIPI